jgi:hypothetical protein
VNPAGVSLAGRRPDEIVRATDTDLFGRDIAQLHMCTDDDLLRNGRAKVCVEEQCVGGQRRKFRAHEMPRRNPAGSVIGVIGVAAEVSN